uniref:DUF4371 domain-containing protein n=1 Tax=Latimeria chalumnae TaxID=7897 RepID=H3A7Q5_LATCH
KKLYYRIMPNGQPVQCTWLSVSILNPKVTSIFCNICIPFGDSTNSAFVKGFQDFKHCYQAVEEHERSKTHNSAVNAYFAAEKGKRMDSLINKNMMEKHKREIDRHIHMMKKIIQAVKFIGKQSLAYRATDESTYSLEDTSLNHGNFLEVILLMAKSDIILDEHVQRAIEDSKKRKKSMNEKGKHGPDAHGCGSLVNFLSKSMVNNIILIISVLVKEAIAKEIGSQKYSIQMDSTQDVSVVDQATIALHYVYSCMVQEQLFAVVHVHDTSGKGLHNALKASLESSGIPLKNILGHSFDGAANMRSSNVGLQAFIKEAAPNSVYVWCYAHVLNLCVADTVSIIPEAKSLFGLLHRTAIFISESHKRMDAWKADTGDASSAAKFKRLQKIGETRWWSKYKALKHIFRTFEDSSEALYATLVHTLIFLSTSEKFDSKTSSEASSLLENFVKFQTVLTAFMFLKMFETLDLTSKYLQTKGLDYMSAWSMVKQATKSLENQQQNFNLIYKKEELDETSLGIDIENDLPEKRIPKRKRMAGEIALHEKHKSSLDCFRVDVYNTVLDQAVNSMKERVDQNRDLISDTLCLDPRRFDQIVTGGLPRNALRKIANLTEVNANDLRKELVKFAVNYENLSKSLPESYVLGTGDDENESDKLNLHTSAYSLLFITYEYVLCLSFVQVSCERAFSYLKLIKSRL